MGWGQQTFITVANFVSRTKWITLEEGVQNGLWAATTSKKDVKNGAFYEPVGQISAGTTASNNDELAKKLWIWTQTELEAWE